MTPEQFFKEYLKYTEKDLEYRPTTGYWKTLELMKKYHEHELKSFLLSDVNEHRIEEIENHLEPLGYSVIKTNELDYLEEKLANHPG